MTCTDFNFGLAFFVSGSLDKDTLDQGNGKLMVSSEIKTELEILR